MDPKLYRAATSGDVQLLKEVADANIEALLSKAPHENTALHIAARLGRGTFMGEILGRCPQLLRMKNSQGDTALHQSLRNKQLYPAIGLLRTDPELALITNNAQESPLHIAVKEELQELVQEMLGASQLPSSSGPTAVGYSAISDDRKRDLVAMKDITGRNALHYAAWRNSAYTVETILRIDCHIVPYATDEGGFSPLHVAAAFGSLDSISKLLEYCPDAVEQVDLNGRNALHIAVLNRKVKSVWGLLTNSNAEVMLKQEDNNGNTPRRPAAHDEDEETFSTVYLYERDGMAIQTLMDKASEETALHSSTLGEFVKEALSEPSAPPRPGIMRAVIPEKWVKTSKGDQQGEAEREAQTYILAATLIATITFAAGIAVPGGFREEGNPGTAVLIDQQAFKAFIILDTIAVCSSVSAVLGFISRNVYLAGRIFLLLGYFLTELASILMVFTFGTGVYVVVSARCKWLAVLVLSICGLTFGFLVLGDFIVKAYLLRIRHPHSRFGSIIFRSCLALVLPDLPIKEH